MPPTKLLIGQILIVFAIVFFGVWAATQWAASMLAYARGTDPFANIGERTVSVQVTSVVRASDKSFQVKWTETAFERGSQSSISRWTGILTVVTKRPTSADTLRKNPLGVYVDAIDWSRELEPATPSPASTQPTPSASSSSAANLPIGSPLDPNLTSLPLVRPIQESQP